MPLHSLNHKFRIKKSWLPYGGILFYIVFLFAAIAVPYGSTAKRAALVYPVPQATPVPVLKVHFIDVGQGDSIFIESPDGNLLIDGGEKNRQALNYLKSIGVNRIDVMVATHPHADHIGGLIEVLESIPTSKVITNGQIYTTSTYEQFLDAIMNTTAAYGEVKKGDRIQAGSLVFSVLSPESLSLENVNNNSIVLKLVYGKFSFLFMGDAEQEIEKNLLDEGLDLKADVLKLGHHASGDASGASFLAQVDPEVTVYSCGADNSYGFPDEAVLKRIKKNGTLICGTDVDGTVILSTDGKYYSITIEN